MPGRRSTRAGAQRNLSAKRYVYFWVDGIHVQARLEDDAHCLLVITGATPEGRRNSSASPIVCARAHNLGKNCSSTSSGVGYPWAPSSRSPMARSASGRRSKRSGRKHVASAVGCTRPLTSLNKLSKSQQSKAKRALQEIWMAETKKDALAAFDALVGTPGGR